MRETEDSGSRFTFYVSGSEQCRQNLSKRLEHGQSLQPFNRVRRRNAARTNVAAVAERVAAERAGFAANQLEPVAPRFVARINDEVQRAVQRHRAGEPRVQRDQGAGREAGAAINALRLVVQRFPFLALVREAIEIVWVEVVARSELRECALIRG